MDKKLQAYYTNSDFITDYMINNLDLENKDTILEPSVGEGIFVDKILSANKNVYIDAYDIDDYAIRVVKQKYSNKENIKIYDISLKNIKKSAIDFRKRKEYDES